MRSHEGERVENKNKHFIHFWPYFKEEVTDFESDCAKIHVRSRAFRLCCGRFDRLAANDEHSPSESQIHS